MEDLLCPTCKIELMEHEASRCLDGWIAPFLGWSDITPDAYISYGRDWCGTTPDGTGGFYNSGRFILPHFSTDVKHAYIVMQKVWEMDPYAFICRDHICINVPVLDQGTIGITKGVSVKGETFTLRVCRAFLNLVAQRQQGGA